MKKIYLFATIFVLLSYSAKAQIIYQTQYQTQADYALYLAEDKWQADISVYWSDKELWAKSDYQDGTWYKTDYKTQADVTICYTEYKTQANLSIFIVKDKSEAGPNTKEGREWLNKIKSK